MIFSQERGRVLRLCFLWLSLGLVPLALGGCATLDTMLGWVGYGSGDGEGQAPEALAMAAMDDFNRGKYGAALKTFEEVKDRFPFSDVALLAELKSADANYHMERYAEAKILYEEFEANHPTNEAVPYVLFQIAMCSYQQIGTHDRDPGSAMTAIQAFERLNRAFPHSPYLLEAQARIAAARDFLAQHEFYVATFYVRTDEYEQAKGRLEYLLATYPEASVVPKASELLAQLQSEKGVEKSWLRYVPTVGLPDWRSFKSAFGILPGGESQPAPGE